MKLTQAQIRRIQMATGLIPIDETEPVIQALTAQFGDETFYIAQSGLLVFDPAEDMRGSCKEPVRAWKIAEFTEKDGQKALDTIEREHTTMVVDLDRSQAGAEDAPPTIN